MEEIGDRERAIEVWIGDRVKKVRKASEGKTPTAVLIKANDASEIGRPYTEFARFWGKVPELRDRRSPGFFLSSAANEKLYRSLGLDLEAVKRWERIYPPNPNSIYSFSPTKFENAVYVGLAWTYEGTGNHFELVLINTPIKSLEDLLEAIKLE